MTREQIKQMVELHTNNVGGNGNVFCTSLELAEITGKSHNNVLADIEDMWYKVRGLLTFQFTSENQYNISNPSNFQSVSNNQGSIGDTTNFQFTYDNQQNVE